MKKKIMTLVLAAIAATGFMASAQSQVNNKMYSPRTFTDYAFEGVLLDIPQQQRIDSLHSALRTPQQKKVHAITMSPDSAKAMPDRHGKKPQRMNGKAMGVMPGVEYVAKVKEILTPDQFDLFMSNIQAMPDNAVNNLLVAPGGRHQAPKDGKACKMDGQQCPNAQAKQCDKACEQKCDKTCEQKCDKACEQKCDKACDRKCDDRKCLNNAGKCDKSNCNADKAHKDKKGAKASKDKKDKKAKEKK